MTDLTERLRKRAEEDAKCAENSKVVADLLRPQLEAFEANEDKGNIYAIRMAVDHRNSVERDGQYAADLLEAATTLETLTQENARLREAGWRGIESAPGPTDEFSFYGPLILVWDGENVSAAKKDRTGSFTDLELVEQDGDWMSIFPNPTHWMPLPPAPAHKALGGGNE